MTTQIRTRALLLALGLSLSAVACDDDNNGGDGSDGAPTDGTDGTPTDGTDGTPTDGTDGTPTDGTDGTPTDGTDDPDGGVLDGSVEPDAGESDAGEPDAGEPDAGTSPIVVGPHTATVLPLSAMGHDRLFGVTFDPAGNFYATGQAATSTDATADFSIIVVKFLPTGAVDTSFGDEGVATVNVTPNGKGAEVGRGIAVQSTGKIVVLGAAEHDVTAAGVLAADTDYVLVRFNTDGTLDNTFGTGGIKRHDFGTGYENVGMSGTTLAGADAPWSLGLTEGDKLVVHGAARAEGDMPGMAGTPRIDTDWLLARLSSEGELDTTFSQDGKVWLDIGFANASARSATVLDDGSILGSGYTTTDVLNPGTSTQQPVIYKVTSAGEFDATFATDDVWEEPGVYYDFTVTPPARAEAYGAALQGDHLVTMGYGPTPIAGGTGSDFVSFRFTDSGKLDTTYGENGARWIDAGGYGDNGRALVVLPDHRVLGIGGGRPAPAEPPTMGNPPSDGMLVLLGEHGEIEEDFGPGGIRLIDFNGGTGDFLWAGAVAPDHSKVAVVGLRAITGGNDDAALVIVPLE